VFNINLAKFEHLSVIKFITRKAKLTRRFRITYIMLIMTFHLCITTYKSEVIRLNEKGSLSFSTYLGTHIETTKRTVR